MYEFRVASNRITSMPNFIKMSPAVLELNHTDRHTWSALYAFISCTSCKERMMEKRSSPESLTSVPEWRVWSPENILQLLVVVKSSSVQVSIHIYKTGMKGLGDLGFQSRSGHVCPHFSVLSCEDLAMGRTPIQGVLRNLQNDSLF
jgi:hypothetical protein